MIPLLHTAISERFRGAARQSAIQIHVTLLYFTYLVPLTTAYMYMYVLFTLIQLWSVPEKSGSMTSTVL